MATAREEEVRRLIIQGETMNVDFKSAMAWDGNQRGLLARAIVAMANSQDGGTLVLGVSEGADGSAVIDGVSAQQSASFEPTKVIQWISQRFEPDVKLRIERVTLDAKLLVVIYVSEFDPTPIVCIGDGPDKGSGVPYFRAGNLLIRNRAAKSEAIQSAEDMHSLIRRAVAKTSNQLLADIRRVIEGDRGREQATISPHDSALEVWRKELGDRRQNWAKNYPDYGTFAMTFLPSSPIEKQLDHAALQKLVQQSKVALHGYKVPIQPWNDQFAEVNNRVGAVQGTYNLDQYQELWQLRDTGAFMYARLIHYVHNDDNGPAMPFEDALLGVLLGFIFARRLYQELSPGGDVAYEFSLLGIKGHRLGSFDSFRTRLDRTAYRSAEENLSVGGTCSVLDLRSAWRPLVHQTVKRLFTLFTWDVQPATIDHYLDQLEGRV